MNFFFVCVYFLSFFDEKRFRWKKRERERTRSSSVRAYPKKKIIFSKKNNFFNNFTVKFHSKQRIKKQLFFFQKNTFHYFKIHSNQKKLNNIIIERRTTQRPHTHMVNIQNPKSKASVHAYTRTVHSKCNMCQ